jgi:hypothetical protein
VEEQPSNHDEEEMEEQEGFEEVIYGRNCTKKRQQVIIGTSRDSEIKAEKKKKHGYISVE